MVPLLVCFPFNCVCVCRSEEGILFIPLYTTGGEDGDGRQKTGDGRMEEERRTRRGVIVCKCLLSFDTVTLSSADNTNYNCTTTAQFPPQLSTNTHIQTPYRPTYRRSYKGTHLPACYTEIGFE